MNDSVKGFAFFSGFQTYDDKVKKIDDLYLYDNRLHKFPNDEIMEVYENGFMFLDGYVTNKKDLCEQDYDNEWSSVLKNILIREKSPQSLRGSFCGVYRMDNELHFFSDHVGSRGLYYYTQNNQLIISNRYCYILEILEKNDISVNSDEQAIKYMLQQGFMLDSTTFCKQIKRVLPGEIINIPLTDNKATTSSERYFLLSNEQDLSITEDEAIDNIDSLFRSAVKREFDKDLEYGYKHLVDLSGGLDSRMVCWVAHSMGYTNQMNFTYCRKDYLDYSIAKEVAMKLKHQFMYMPLDDCGWMYDLEKLVRLNNGAAEYLGITGGNRFLESINSTLFGIEHTGMVGDAILSTFFSDETYSYSKPLGTENCYSDLVQYRMPTELLEFYDNREIYSVYTRGFLGAQSSYFIRQNYVECASPFLDVDLLKYIFSIPFSMRRKHKLYFAWINKYYPDSTQYGWEKWGGLRPIKNNWWKSKIRTEWNKVIRKINRYIGTMPNDDMNPLDYWVENNDAIRNWMNDYYEDNEKFLSDIDTEIQKDLRNHFHEGGIIEKAQVLTCLAMLKMNYRWEKMNDK